MKFLIIAKREYLKMVKSKAFWLATLLIPLLMIVVSLVQAYAGQSFQNKIEDMITNQRIAITDETGLINQDMLASDNIIFISDLNTAKELVTKSDVNALIHFPSDILENKIIQVYAQDQGVLSSGLYDQFAQTVLRISVLNEIADPLRLAILNGELKVNTLIYVESEFIANDWSRFVIPLASVILYFIFTSFATANLLLSVSEEKENRMIEIVLSTIDSKSLIWGKIIGLVSAVLTQIVILIIMVLLIYQFGSNYYDIPINLEDLKLDPVQLLISLIYLLFGFLLLANTMVACGAAMPSYREASNFSSIFIILSIFPIYFFALILAEPSGPIALVTSYFPFTAPMILMLRNALNVLSAGEILLSFAVLAFYVLISAKVAYKMFEYGAMEYSNKISFKDFFRSFRSGKF